MLECAKNDKIALISLSPEKKTKAAGGSLEDAGEIDDAAQVLACDEVFTKNFAARKKGT